MPPCTGSACLPPLIPAISPSISTTKTVSASTGNRCCVDYWLSGLICPERVRNTLLSRFMAPAFVMGKEPPVGSKYSSALHSYPFFHFLSYQEFFVSTTILGFHPPFQSIGESLMPWKRMLAWVDSGSQR